MKVCNTHQMPYCRICNKTEKAPFGKRNKPLKKSKRQRPLSPVAMDNLVADVMLRDGRCVAIDHTESNCKGRTEAHHLIPQRILRAHYPLGHEVFTDLANVVSLCQRHHGNVEAHILTLPDEQLPEGFEDFKKRYGFEEWWDAEIARRVA